MQERQIRKFIREDATALWALRTQAILYSCASHYAREKIENWAYTPQPDCFADMLLKVEAVVVYSEDQRLGYAFLDEVSNRIEGCFVDPLYSRTGIGRLLITDLETKAFNKEKGRLTLLSSLNAVPFYQALGYQIKRFKLWRLSNGVELSCVEMSKSLGSLCTCTF